MDSTNHDYWYTAFVGPWNQHVRLCCSYYTIPYDILYTILYDAILQDIVTYIKRILMFMCFRAPSNGRPQLAQAQKEGRQGQSREEGQSTLS